MMDPGNSDAKNLIGGEQNAGKIKQMQIKMKYQRSSSIIREEEDEEESFEDSEESEEAKKEAVAVEAPENNNESLLPCFDKQKIINLDVTV